MTGQPSVRVGYCSMCRAAVELNELARCPLHPLQLVVDICEVDLKVVEQAKANILSIRARRLRRELIGWFIAISSLLVLGYVVIFIIEF